MSTILVSEAADLKSVSRTEVLFAIYCGDLNAETSGNSYRVVDDEKFHAWQQGKEWWRNIKWKRYKYPVSNPERNEKSLFV